MSLNLVTNLSHANSEQILEGALHDAEVNRQMAAVVTRAGKAAMVATAYENYNPSQPSFSLGELKRWMEPAGGYEDRLRFSADDMGKWSNGSLIPAGFATPDLSSPGERKLRLTSEGLRIAPAWAGYALGLAVKYPFSLREIFGGMQATSGSPLRAPLLRTYLVAWLLSREQEEFTVGELATEVGRTYGGVHGHLEALISARLASDPSDLSVSAALTTYEVGGNHYTRGQESSPLGRLLMDLIEGAPKAQSAAQLMTRLRPKDGGYGLGIKESEVSEELEALKESRYIRILGTPNPHVWSAARFIHTRELWSDVIKGMAELLQAYRTDDNEVLATYRHRAHSIVTDPARLRKALAR